MVAMPRVLLISRCPPWPLHLGDRLIIWHLARELAQRGHVPLTCWHSPTAPEITRK